jgi:formamidopyrimidine-DNA glycosylase
LPELPEVEAVRRHLEPWLTGARLDGVEVRRPDLRRPFPSRFRERLVGTTVLALERRAKYLLAPLSSGETLLVHLGMSGSFRVRPAAVGAAPARSIDPGPDPHDHVVLRTSANAIVTFNDPRRFGLMDLLSPVALERHPVLSRLGPEPLSAAFDADALARACQGRSVSIKAALLDQRVVAGLGNIYASEALHRAGLSPRRRASTLATRSGLPRDPARRLAAAVKRVLTEAIRQSLGSSEGGAAGFRVYERAGQPCRRTRCAGIIVRRTQAGRSTYYCPVCQR